MPLLSTFNAKIQWSPGYAPRRLELPWAWGSWGRCSLRRPSWSDPGPKKRSCSASSQCLGGGLAFGEKCLGVVLEIRKEGQDSFQVFLNRGFVNVFGGALWRPFGVLTSCRLHSFVGVQDGTSGFRQALSYILLILDRFLQVQKPEPKTVKGSSLRVSDSRENLYK